MSEAAADCLPILVGVTGKRVFDAGDATRNACLLSHFMCRFATLVDRLDHDLLPDTPKVLLCGGAAGADLAAARVVHGRPGWSIVLMLPFDRTIFERDFAEPPYSGDLPFLHELIADRERVIVKQMRPLHVEHYDDSRLEPAGAARIQPERLAGDKDARSQHFEQLGMWIARYATLLVAAAPEQVATKENPFRLGGTARVIAYRRTATPDRPAKDVIARSSELLSNSPFEEADGGYVLWIDPTRDTPKTGGALPGIEVLAPVQRLLDLGKVDARMSDTVDAIYAAPMHPHDREPDSHAARCHGALAAARAFQRFHRRRHVPALSLWRRFSVSAATFGDEHPADFLDQVRDGALKRQQYGGTDWTRRAQRGSALLFFLALVGYEIHTEFAHDATWLLLVYIALLLGIAAVAGVVGLFKVQLRAEDYRGLREMMRVQVAWWSTGIDRMVDRVHLRSIDTDLRLVREAAAAITMWAVLRCRRLGTCNGAAVARDGANEHVSAWIKGQAAYFSDNAGLQFGAKRLTETAFVLTFAAAIAALSVLLAVEWLVPDLAGPIRRAGTPALAALPFAGAFWSAAALWLVTGRLRGVGGRRVQWLAPSLTAAAAIAALLLEAEAAQLACGVFSTLPAWTMRALHWLGPGTLAPLLATLVIVRIPGEAKAFRVQELTSRQVIAGTLLLTATVLLVAIGLAPLIDPADLAGTAHDLVLAQAVLLLGGTGMVRWYSERRNHLAQASHYDDMLRAFRRAKDWLAHCDDTRDDTARQRLVELGELALDENEAWLKAHRDRPTEPIAGA